MDQVSRVDSANDSDPFLFELVTTHDELVAQAEGCGCGYCYCGGGGCSCELVVV